MMLVTGRLTLTGRSTRSIPGRYYHNLFIQPAKDGTPNLTTPELTAKFASEIGQAGDYTVAGLQETLIQRQKLMNFLPKSVEELPPRRMADSFVSAIIPLKDNPEIRERYVTYEGSVRIGRVLEDMDVFSVYCGFQHILNPRGAGHKNPYSVVTALVDSIHVANDRMRTNENVRLSGHVSYAGRSSLEVCLVVDQKDPSGTYQKIFDAIFLMVARDPMNTGGALVNPLIGETKEELEYLEQGKERQKLRKTTEQDSLQRKPPTEEEREIIHNMFIESEQNKSKTVAGEIKFMADSSLKTLFICHPQYRNRYNKIFGGFIMRQACELAFTNSFIYGCKRPRLVNIDDIIFRKPVEIGAILRYTSTIGYVEGNYIHTPVKAEVLQPLTGQPQITNVFQFTFRLPSPVTPLAFSTYREAMIYLESRRHFKKLMAQYGET